jgi:hypothetical protein
MNANSYLRNETLGFFALAHQRQNGWRSGVIFHQRPSAFISGFKCFRLNLFASHYEN